MSRPSCAASAGALVLLSGLLIAASAARASIEGYCWPLSVAPGETISFMVSSSTSYGVSLVRYQRSGDSNSAIVMTTLPTQPGGLQTAPPSAWEGCAWQVSFQFTIPADWNSGIYAAECAGTSKFRITFVVRPLPEDLGDFAVLVNTNTWSAYNDWGGRGKYTDPPAHFLSFLRPNPYTHANGGGQNHLVRAELWVHDWLAGAGYRADSYSDWDLHQSVLNLHDYKGLILHTHPEYWTHEMMDRLEEYLATGGSVLYMGGNGLYERVVFSPDGKTVEFFPENYCGSLSCRKESFFRNLDPPRPERAVLGVAYRSDGFQTFAPFEVLLSAHRFFDGTGLHDGDLIGATGLNGGGASGWEMDTSIPGTAPDGVLVDCYGTSDRGSPPANIELLARGTNTGGYGADMTYYRAPGGGGMFAAGSLSFGGSLVVDATLQRIVRNVLDEFLQGPLAVDRSPAPRAGEAALHPNVPNPFTSATEIRFALAETGPVRLRIYDPAGRLVRTLVDAAMPAGPAPAVRWDGRDDAGRPVGAGLYLLKLESAAGAESRRMLRLN